MKNPDRKNVSKVLIIISKATGKIRRIIDADNDVEYAHHEYHMHPGEQDLYLSHEVYDNIETVDALHHLAATEAGFPRAPHHKETRHAHVDHNGVVINIVEADLTCGDSGAHLGNDHKLIQHPHAHVGWKHINGKLVE